MCRKTILWTCVGEWFCWHLSVKDIVYMCVLTILFTCVCWRYCLHVSVTIFLYVNYIVHMCEHYRACINWRWRKQAGSSHTSTSTLVNTTRLWMLIWVRIYIQQHWKYGSAIVGKQHTTVDIDSGMFKWQTPTYCEYTLVLGVYTYNQTEDIGLLQ